MFYLKKSKVTIDYNRSKLYIYMLLVVWMCVCVEESKIKKFEHFSLKLIIKSQLLIWGEPVVIIAEGRGGSLRGIRRGFIVHGGRGRNGYR